MLKLLYTDMSLHWSNSEHPANSSLADTTPLTTANDNTAGGRPRSALTPVTGSRAASPLGTRARSRRRSTASRPAAAVVDPAEELKKVDVLLVRLLTADTPKAVAAAFARLSRKAVHAVLGRLVSLPNGAAAAAALLACLSPISSVR